MMNLSVITTAVPSLSRLAVELQPNIDAFATTEQHSLRSLDKYTLISFVSSHPHKYAVEGRLRTYKSVQLDNCQRLSNKEDTESLQGW
jgi:hypothetical protein